MKLTMLDQVVNYDNPMTLEEVACDLNVDNVLAATVNGRLRELTYVVTKDSSITFLGYDSTAAIHIYESTLRFIVAMAVHRIFPKATIHFNYSISRSILAIFEHLKGNLNREKLTQLKTEVDKIIAGNYQIKRRRISIGEALKLYKSYGMQDKVDIIKYREEEYVNLYECEGYMNYMFGYMLPSTGYIKKYDFRLYHPGFLIHYPRAELNGDIPKFIDEPTFGKALKNAAQWGKIISGNTIPRMNEWASEPEKAIEFINMCETKHFHMLSELGDMIASNLDSIRLIGIAGPSSSGKTTFAKRLRIELMTRGIHPIRISIDDYYLGKDLAPKDVDGKPDLEHIEALDLEKFNEDMLALIQGETVTLPHFNFQTGKREEGQRLHLKADTPIIIEGIHALNERLTSSIPKHQKFKIYISPQTQLHIDDHNPISITELRLLRRIVRDQQFRGTPAIETMDMWPSVRRGEFKWIYPFQNEADYVFNSELSYELAVLKKYAMQQLRAIQKDSKHFITANRLLKFLKYFTNIDDRLVPINSLVREFIGESCFE